MNRVMCIVVLMACSTSVGEGHEWTDATGQRKAEATYVSSDSKYVYVRLADARSARVERDRLSAGDRIYVAQLEGSPGVDAKMQPGAASAAPKPVPSDFRYVYRGCGTAQHLAGARGTTVYYGKGGLIVAALAYKSFDQDFIYYTVDEHGFEQEQWAFARHYRPCHGFAVWRFRDINQDGNLEWVKFYDAERYKGVAPN